MTQSITVQVKSVYGKDTVYPICDNAKAFASIANTSTLTLHTLKNIISLGYTINYHHPALKIV